MSRQRALYGAVCVCVMLMLAATAAQAQGYTFVTKWGSSGSSDGQFNWACDVAVHAAGNVYVVDRDNNRIQEFDANGSFLAKWGSYGSGDGQFYSPTGAAVDASGNVYVADSYNHRIQVFAPPNSPPTAPTVAITPADPTVNDSLRGNASGSTDPDGDPVTYSYQWHKNGTLQPGRIYRTLAAQWTRLGQTWTCVVTPSDGAEDGPTGEDEVTINTRPGPPTVVINGRDAKGAVLNPDTTQNLVSQILACDDPDGDAITHAYQWYKNGVLQPGVVWRSIGAWRTRVGQEWKVVVTPSDLHGEGKSGEAIVVIEAAKSAVVTLSSLAALPTAAGAELTFTLSAEANVTCEVLNIAGRAVKTIVADRPMTEGINSLAWDGCNAAGLRAPAGMYLVRMTATGATGARWTAVGTLSLTR